MTTLLDYLLQMAILYEDLKSYEKCLPDQDIEFKNLHIDHNCVLQVPDFELESEMKEKDRHY
jgi:hypothetical protein